MRACTDTPTAGSAILSALVKSLRVFTLGLFGDEIIGLLAPSAPMIFTSLCGCRACDPEGQERADSGGPPHPPLPDSRASLTAEPPESLPSHLDIAAEAPVQCFLVELLLPHHVEGCVERPELLTMRIVPSAKAGALTPSTAATRDAARPFLNIANSRCLPTIIPQRG